MSAQELDRLTVIERVLEKRISQVEASKQLRITPRQLRRLMKRYRDHGATGLVSKKRGMPISTRSKRPVRTNEIRRRIIKSAKLV